MRFREPGWTNLTLGDVTTEAVERLGNSPANYPVYGVDRSVGLTAAPKYVSSNLSRYKKILPGMFVYNPMRLNIGSIGYSTTKHGPGLVSPDYVVFQCNKDRLDPEFLSYYVKGSEWRTWTEASGVGSVRVRIYFKELARMPIVLPTIDEQRTIVSILRALDGKIEIDHKMNQTLEAMARVIFKSWFVDFDPVRAKAEGRDPGLPHDLAALFPDSFENSELGEIPKGWRVGKFSDFIERLPVGQKYDQKTAMQSGIVPILDQGKSGFIGYHNDRPGVEASFDRPVATFANHTCYMRLVTFPFSAIQNVLPFVGKGVSTLWAYYATEGKLSFSEYKGHWPEFVVQESIMPPEELTKAFGRMVLSFIKKLRQNEEESQTLASLRDALLPKLLSGEIRVKGIA